MQSDSGVSALPEHHGDSFGSIVSELAALLDHVQGSIKAIETSHRPRRFVRGLGACRR
jgi:hypothetical protein